MIFFFLKRSTLGQNSSSTVLLMPRPMFWAARDLFSSSSFSLIFFLIVISSFSTLSSTSPSKLYFLVFKTENQVPYSFIFFLSFACLAGVVFRLKATTSVPNTSFHTVDGNQHVVLFNCTP